MIQRLITFSCIFLITVSCKSQESAATMNSAVQNETNLDLEVVATLFGEASNLEEFEKLINDPEKAVSNLDLNKDNEVDYLRVVEKTEGEIHTVYIQACVDKDTFTNVASIIVKKDKNGATTVTIIGDEAIYGESYVLVPTYETTPVVVTWFWSPSYVVWVSPYRFGYYPAYYRRRAVVPTASYRRNVRVRTTLARVTRTNRRVRVRRY